VQKGKIVLQAGLGVQGFADAVCPQDNIKLYHCADLHSPASNRSPMAPLEWVSHAGLHSKEQKLQDERGKDFAEKGPQTWQACPKRA
jgi:hypothetical protein